MAAAVLRQQMQGERRYVPRDLYDYYLNVNERTGMAEFHYELAEVLVKTLEQLPNIQVIPTPHNTKLLSNRIMRPDCYFILSDNQLASFANATRRELREGHSLEKLYMSGEFDG